MATDQELEAQMATAFAYIDECKSKGENVLYSEVIKRHPDSVFLLPVMMEFVKTLEPSMVKKQGLDWIDNHLIIDDASEAIEKRIMEDPEKASNDPASLLID